MEVFAIRNAEIDDIEILVQFNSQMAMETENKLLDRSVLKEGLQKALQQNHFCRYFVAEIKGEVIGQTMLTYEWSDWRNGQIWWLQSVFVDKKYRQKGVFRALYSHIKALAKSLTQVRALRLYVKNDNNQGQTVYKQLGLYPAGYHIYEDEW